MTTPFSAQIDPIILDMAARPCGVALAEVPHDQPNNDAVGCRMSKMVKKGLLVGLYQKYQSEALKRGLIKRNFKTNEFVEVPDEVLQELLDKLSADQRFELRHTRTMDND